MKTTMRKDLFVLLALAALFLPEEAFGKEKEKDKIEKKDEPKKEVEDDGGPADSGFSFGVRAGYALPMGSIAKDPIMGAGQSLSKNASGMIPLGADLGYRIDPHWYVGAAFTYGYVAASGDICKRLVGTTPGCSSSGSNIRIGATIRYTFSPQAKLAPWVAVGSAYEVLSTSASGAAGSLDVTYKGIEYFNVHVGADYRLAPAVAIGPMIGFSLGQYNAISASASDGRSLDGDFNSTTLHHWVTLGLQGRYDL